MPAKNLKRIVSYIDPITYEEIRTLLRENPKYPSISSVVKKLLEIGLKNWGDGLDEYEDVDWSQIPEDEVEKIHESLYGDDDE